MDQLIDNFDSLPSYRIDLRRVKDPHPAHRIKSIIQEHFKRTGFTGQARLVNAHQGVIEVRGDITEDLLNKIVTSNHDNGYKITRHD